MSLLVSMLAVLEIAEEIEKAGLNKEYRNET